MSMWKNLGSPFFVLAPMDDVTDIVFRKIIARHAPTDVYFTEFANADGMQSPGRNAVEKKLLLEDTAAPVVAQIWGKNPDAYYETSKELALRGFSGIDINMGCPVRAVVKNGCCSALIDDPEHAAELIAAAREGIKASDREVALSVKTRLGFSKVETKRWCGFLLEQNIAALTVHGRIAVEMSKFPADWDEISKVVSLRDELAPDTIVIGNGDILSRAQGEEYTQRYGVDGVMVGRGIFRNPTLFTGGEPATRDKRIEMLRDHLQLWQETWGEDKPFDVMKKFFKMYIAEWDGASALRAQLMQARSYEEVLSALDGVQQS